MLISTDPVPDSQTLYGQSRCAKRDSASCRATATLQYCVCAISSITPLAADTDLSLERKAMTPKVSHRLVRCEASCNGHDSMLIRRLYQRKSFSRLSFRPRRKTSRDSDTAGSRTHRNSATDEDAEVLTLQSSRSSISGRSSITSGKGSFYRLRPLERAGSSTRTFYHFIGSQAEGLDAVSSSAGHTPFLNGTPSRTPISTPKETPGVELEEMP